MHSRPPAVAGMFYPDDAGALRASISDALNAASKTEAEHSCMPNALIVPHAGYIYSGLTAAFAYQSIQGAQIHRVILFGPAHRVGFHGMAVPEAQCFETPLGPIPIDQPALKLALGCPGVQQSDHPHAMEHSLEVQLPFLQSVLGDFTLLPVCIGMAEDEAVAQLMAQFIAQPGTLLLISSDLSHFLDYDSAQAKDSATIKRILSLQGDISHEQACGATGINALLQLAGEHGLQADLLDYRNSGDTAGDKQRVVGYASISFSVRGADD